MEGEKGGEPKRTEQRVCGQWGRKGASGGLGVCSAQSFICSFVHSFIHASMMPDYSVQHVLVLGPQRESALNSTLLALTAG